MTVESASLARTARHSPLRDRASALAGAPAAVRVRELPFLTQLNLRVDPDAPGAAAVAHVLGAPLPTEPNTAVLSGDLTVLWLGPDEWLVVSAAHAPADLDRSLRRALGSQQGAVVDLSAHRTTVELSGARALEVLAKGCSLDLHPRVFTRGRCAQTLLARAPVLLLSRGGGDPAYCLLVRASFAIYLADWLLDASIEYAADDS